ncbi:MAG: AMP-binding protein [Lachnospiraceae bacterium]|nr:AMP-binding protein [Lachnospiraceae bacterium]
MALFYEEYYKEIKDDAGNILRIETTVGDDFNFAYDVVDRFAKNEPEKLAMLHRTADGVENRFSFSDLSRLSNKAANMLTRLGIKKGQPVMLLLKRRYEFWISILAIHKIGAVAVPTSHMVSAKDIRERIKTAGISAVICVANGGIKEKVCEAINGLAMEGLDTITITVGESGNVADCYKYNADNAINSADRREKIYDYWTEMEKSPEFFARKKTSVTDHMLYYFTSGTSGSPKAVIQDFSYPLAHIYTAKNWHGITEGDLHLTVADSGWAKSAWGKLYGQMFMGAAILVYDYEQFYAADLLHLLEKEKVNTFCAPPTIYKYLVLEDLEKYNLEHLRCATTAGEPMPIEVAQKFESMTDISIREGFGQTETALLICTPVGGGAKTGTLGKASPLYEILLVDEDDKPVAAGEEGEIVLKVPENGRLIGVFKGYLGDDNLYKEVFRDGLYHTRDKAILDNDGYYCFMGRNDDVIKSSGYRIGPSEVEDVLMQHPAVFECAVTGYPSKRRGTVVKASVILKSGYTASEQMANELKEYVKERVAIYKYPRMISFPDSLPRTANGKISRAKIRKLDEKALAY